MSIELSISVKPLSFPLLIRHSLFCLWADSIEACITQDCTIPQHMFVAHCLEVGTATTTTPVVTPSFVRDIEALVFANVSFEPFCQGASTFNTMCGVARKLNKEQLNIARVWESGASATSISVTNLRTLSSCLKVILPMSHLSFILILNACSIGMNMLRGVHHHKALTYHVHVSWF